MSEIIITKENFEKDVLNSAEPVVVDFWASWCAPCKMLAPEIAELAAEGIKVGKVNVDEEGELAMKYGIMSIPTVILFKDGKIEKKTVGYMTKDQLKAELGL